MVNLNLWLTLTEEQYQALMSKYQDEMAMKFALSVELHKFVKEKTKDAIVAHFEIDNSEEIA
jgi:hypothetical protein